MKKLARYVSLFLLFAMLASAVSACGTEIGYQRKDGFLIKENPVAVAVILGNHANAMAIPEEVYDYLETQLEDCVYGGYVCAIVPDSTPIKVELADSDFYKQDARNGQILKQKLDDRPQKLVNSLKRVGAADSTEVDLLGAIREAKNALSSPLVGEIKDKRIIIIDTGLSTTGDLNLRSYSMAKNRKTGDEIAAILKANNLLPDLSGISVLFVGNGEGLSEVAMPQQMTTGDKRYIKELWESIIRESNALEISHVSFAGWGTPNISTEDEQSPFPYVSSILFNVVDETGTIAPPGDPDPGEDPPGPLTISIEIPSTQVGFKPDSAEYRDEAQAEQILSGMVKVIKDYLIENPDKKIWLVGTSATTTKGGKGDPDLAYRRANTVKETLGKLGVSEERLLVVGLGARFPWHVDEFPNGDFDTIVAQPNRAVWVMSTEEDKVEKYRLLMDAYHSGNLLPEAMSVLDQLVEQ